VSKPERTYAIGLIVLAFVFFFAVGQFLLMIWRPWSPDFAKFSGLLWYIVFIIAVYFLITVAALWILVSRPAWASIALAAANVMLVIYFPIGTCFAIYYFRKVSKQLVPRVDDRAAPAGQDR
jgi:uncharacterized membrane protein YkgB